MTTTLLIACHGDTFATDTVRMRIGAKTDLPLAQVGMEQAQRLGEYLKNNNLTPALMVTSELERAVQTALEVQKALGVMVPIEKMAAFNDIDYGVDNNQPEEKVLERIGEAALKTWEDEAVPPLGWHVDTIGLRASWHDFGTHIAKDYGGKVVLVITHDTIARFASILTGDPKAFHVNGNVHLSAGHFGHLVYNGPNWQCLGWNLAPDSAIERPPVGAGTGE